MNDRRDVRMQVLLTARHKEMLEWLSGKHGRSMNDVVRRAIDGAYRAEQARAARTAAVSETIKRQ